MGMVLVNDRFDASAFALEPTNDFSKEITKPHGDIYRQWTSKKCAEVFVPKRILRHGIATIVFWQDGTKTVVKRHADEPDNEYTAFTAALAVKVFGSNSQVKSVLRHKTEAVEPKKSKNQPVNCENCEPPAKKRKFREGDMVKYAHYSPGDKGKAEKYYPPIGTVGRAERVCDDGDVLVHWPRGTTEDDGWWYCNGDSLEVVE